MSAGVTVVPLWAASACEVRAAVLSVSDALQDPQATALNWQTRHRELLATPSAGFWASALLFDADGAAGWTGWLPYPGTPGTWQSSTWLAPRLRGRGLLPWLRCDQVHRAAALATRWVLDAPRFISSIDAANVRSLRASRRYAATSGWDGWVRVEESTRTAWVLPWPSPAMPHRCFLPGHGGHAAARADR